VFLKQLLLSFTLNTIIRSSKKRLEQLPENLKISWQDFSCNIYFEFRSLISDPTKTNLSFLTGRSRKAFASFVILRMWHHTGRNPVEKKGSVQRRRIVQKEVVAYHFTKLRIVQGKNTT